MSDFDGDGKTDLLWRQKTTGKNAVWYLDGTNRSGSKALLSLTDLQWMIVN